MTTAITTKLLWPGQPNRIYQVPESVLSSDEWSFQIKKNGWRDIIRCEPGEPVCHYNRHGKPAAPDGTDWAWLAEVFPAPFVLDTEKIGFRQAGQERNCRFIIDLLAGDDRQPYEIRLNNAHGYLNQSLHLQSMAPLESLRYWDHALLISDLSPKGRFFGCDLPDVFLNPDTNQWIVVLSLQPTELWKAAWDDILQGDPDGPNEGLVFKRTTHQLAWHSTPGVKDPNQLKLRAKG